VQHHQQRTLAEGDVMDLHPARVGEALLAEVLGADVRGTEQEQRHYAEPSHDHVLRSCGWQPLARGGTPLASNLGKALPVRDYCRHEPGEDPVPARKGEKKTMTPLHWNAVATDLAIHARKHFSCLPRGAVPVRLVEEEAPTGHFLDDGNVVVGVFGNDNYLA